MTAPLIFDRRAVRLHRDRAARTVHQVAGILHDAAERLLDRLDDTTVRFSQALDVGGAAWWHPCCGPAASGS